MRKIVTGFVIFNVIQSILVIVLNKLSEVPAIVSVAVNLGMIASVIVFIAALPNIVISILGVIGILKKTVPWWIALAEVVSFVVSVLICTVYLGGF